MAAKLKRRPGCLVWLALVMFGCALTYYVVEDRPQPMALDWVTAPQALNPPAAHPRSGVNWEYTEVGERRSVRSGARWWVWRRVAFCRECGSPAAVLGYIDRQFTARGWHPRGEACMYTQTAGEPTVQAMPPGSARSYTPPNIGGTLIQGLNLPPEACVTVESLQAGDTLMQVTLTTVNPSPLYSFFYGIGY